MLAVTALAGCTSADDDPTPVAGNCTLTITLQADSTPAGRGGDEDLPWEENPSPEAGLPDESKIGNVTLFLVTPTDRYINLNATPTGSGDGYYHYSASINLKSDFVEESADGRHTLSGRIIAIANMVEKPTNPTESRFDIGDIRTLGAIPMWGVACFNDRELRANSTVDLGNVKLLRAVSKITVMLDEAYSKLYDIVRIEPLQEGYNRFGNPAPAGADKATDTGKLPIEGCFNPVAKDAEGQSDAALYFYGLNTPEVRCYAAERDCTGEGVFPLSFNVTVKRRNSTEPLFTGQIYLCDYAKGNPVDGTGYKELVRNHDYQFILHLTPLDFIVSFKKWAWGGKVHLELE